MQPAKILAAAHATTKHESLVGSTLLLVQPLGVDDAPDGPPQLAVDRLGGRKGDRVMITSDGSFMRELTGSTNCPARWSTLGIIDD